MANGILISDWPIYLFFSLLKVLIFDQPIYKKKHFPLETSVPVGTKHYRNDIYNVHLQEVLILF
jgi:hypothetical protein